MSKKIYCLIFLLIAIFLFRGLYFSSAQDTHEPIVKDLLMEKKTPPPEFLYKIIAPADWQESLSKHYLVNSVLDQDFIHLAKEEQITHVVQKFWNEKNHFILKLNVKKLLGSLIYEANPGGSTQYYHLYEGKIPLDAVEEISKFKTNQ